MRSRWRAWVTIACAAALVAAACSSSSGAASGSSAKGATATTPPPAAEPGGASALPARPSVGCTAAAKGSVATGEVTRTMTSGSKVRTYLRYVPPGVSRTTPLPVVFDIHGLGSNMTQQETVTQFEKLAATEHFIVLTPNGLDAHWNTIDQRPNGDVDFLMALLDRTERDLCVDTARVYSTGYSDGGLMSSVLACLVPDRIAAVGLVSGITHGPGCHPSRPVPAIVFWGKQDLVLPFYGGLGEALRDLLSGKAVPPNLTAPTAPVAHQDGFPPVEQVVGQWATTDGCRPDAPTKVAVASDVEERIYAGCRDGSSIRFYVVSDGGHAWPGSRVESAAGAANPGGRAAIIGYATMKIDATALIWKFFRQYALSS